MQVGVITNPNSKKNFRRPQRRRSLEQAVGHHGVVRETRSLEDLPRAIGELLDAGCQYYVCDGGDGTLHWVLNSLHDAVKARAAAGGSAELPVVVPTNGGTVDFVARKAGLKGDAGSSAARRSRRSPSTPAAPPASAPPTRPTPPTRPAASTASASPRRSAASPRRSSTSSTRCRRTAAPSRSPR
jgi:hypothetical protein